MCDHTEISRRIKEVVVRTLGLQVAPQELPEREMLFGEGDNMGIDSIATLEIIMALEDEFGFEVDDDDLNAELVASIASMTDYVAARSRDTGELM